MAGLVHKLQVNDSFSGWERRLVQYAYQETGI